MLKKIYRDRLEKLAQHLETGTLGHKVFDFSTLNENIKSFDEPVGCGTNGCAIGELPIVFPNHFKFCGFEIVNLRTGEDSFIGHADWFGLCYDVYGSLFDPGRSRPWSKKILNNKASRKDVAKGIRDFLEWDRLGYYDAWLDWYG